MITADQLPDDAVAAAEYEACCEARPNIRKVIAAAINAWPGIKEEHRPNITFDGKPITVGYIILPLPKEREHD